jgi:uncharacterized protein
MPRMDGVGTVVVDCEAGRRMGCRTLCCQLFVPLSLNEMRRGLQAQTPYSTLLKQEPDGYCTYLDRANHRCTVWRERPVVCRRYNCNADPKLQVVLREGMTSFGRLIEQAKRIPRDQWQQIPLCMQPADDEFSFGEEPLAPEIDVVTDAPAPAPRAKTRTRARLPAGSRQRKSKKI